MGTRVSVVVPVDDQESWPPGALASLRARPQAGRLAAAGRPAHALAEWSQRDGFTVDAHADELVEFLRARTR